MGGGLPASRLVPVLVWNSVKENLKVNWPVKGSYVLVGGRVKQDG